MDAQSIIAGIIVLAALGYVGILLRKKLRGFRPRTAKCADDCGCGTSKSGS